MSDDTCACGGNCACGNGGGHSHSHTQRQPMTRDEYVARLEQYLVDLKAEIEAVEDELAQLRQEA